jgi:hypothetical protein
MPGGKKRKKNMTLNQSLGKTAGQETPDSNNLAVFCVLQPAGEGPGLNREISIIPAQSALTS